MDKARDAQAVLRLIVLNRVAAGDDAVCLNGLGVSALQNGADVLLRQAVRHAEQVHRDLRHAAHGVDVAQRVRRGDLAKEVGIVHDGGEKVDRFNVISDEEVTVFDVRQIMQNFRQGARP